MRGKDLRDALRLVLITPGDRALSATVDLVEGACRGGVTAVLVREPQRHVADRMKLALEISSITQAEGAALLVHHDVSVALATGAQGVHTGFGGPSIHEITSEATDLVVGKSCHWPLAKEDLDAGYAFLSPFRETHHSHPRPLLEELQTKEALKALGGIPVVALGGLDADDISDLPDGLAGVAVIRAIADASQPESAARKLRSAVEERSFISGGAHVH